MFSLAHAGIDKKNKVDLQLLINLSSSIAKKTTKNYSINKFSGLETQPGSRITYFIRQIAILLKHSFSCHNGFIGVFGL